MTNLLRRVVTLEAKEDLKFANEILATLLPGELLVFCKYINFRLDEHNRYLSQNLFDTQSATGCPTKHDSW